MQEDPSNEILVDHLFRHEAGKMIAVLTRLFGMHNLSMAEDVVQDAFLKATQTWKFKTVPDNPSAWLMQVAKNKALDILRRKNVADHYSLELSTQLQEATGNYVDQVFLDTEIEDSQLQLIFACCHPSLKEEDKVALTLKTVSGFGVKEIANALLTQEETIQKRIYRAKQFIQQNNIELEIPTGKALQQRLDTVHTVLYLIFNEGYNASKSDELIRKDICAEAMRLCLLLCEHKTVTHPASFALLALMCFQASRFESRLDKNNTIILLQQQDRSSWNRELIDRGYYYLNKSSSGENITVYHIESAIAAEHCLAKNFASTNFTRLLHLYNMLYQMKPTPIVQMNKAIVLSYTGKTKEAIELMRSIEGIELLLKTQYMFNAVLGELHIRNNQSQQATDYLEKALQLTQSDAEKKLLKEKINTLRSIQWS
ncbi:sigma-70 family RNA polymerase sigma factor [Panacibacter ginsenosidivorans]|uniref:Sigma-70 family RNA polymerase sigma factor n=1 Tax=Panacibacter ginsenosidivorans TaxID=1813871 RepID=A0A5B8V8B7_9BACT|nr:sigma-70 family RNA polymerase sigma factor [Panacibacter ginsenosidivorans]QEC66956.1 sigma-70 family RNA polymerase sigma factor [Panacibacter ginsenosidivorans]